MPVLYKPFQSTLEDKKSGLFAGDVCPTWWTYTLTMVLSLIHILAPKTPAKAEATAITTFRIISHTDFFIADVYKRQRVHREAVLLKSRS